MTDKNIGFSVGTGNIALYKKKLGFVLTIYGTMTKQLRFQHWKIYRRNLQGRE